VRALVPQHRLALTLAVTALAVAAPTADAAYTGTVDQGAKTATVTGSGPVGLSTSGGLVRHKDIGPGFASDADFDSSAAGDQTVPDTGGWAVTATGGGRDRLEIEEKEPTNPISFASGHTFFPGGVPCVVRDPNDRRGSISFSQHPAQETRFCYQAGFIEVDVVQSGAPATDFGVLDTERGVTLELFGGAGDDAVTEVADVPSSVQGEFHNPESVVHFSGGGGSDQATFDDGPSTAPATYKVANGAIRKTGLPGLFFDSSVDFLALYPQRGPSKITIGRTGGASLQIFGGFFGQAGPDKIDARNADAPLFATGSSGDDTILGSVFPDYIDGGGGNDKIDSRDASFDQVLCNGGTGTVTIDTTDRVTDCPTAKSSPPLIALTGARFSPSKVKRGKRLTFEATNTAPGKVTLKFDHGGGTKTIAVKLGPNTVSFKPPAKLAKKKGRHSVTARLVASGGKKSKPVKLSLTVR
jgi:hypothetical protein